MRKGIGDIALSWLLRELESKKSSKNLRDASIVRLLSTELLRIGEILALNTSSVDLDEDRLFIKSNGHHGPQKVALSADTAKALKAWLIVRGEASGPLFISFNRRENGKQTRLTRIGLYFSLRKLASSIGLKCNPEALRIEYAKSMSEHNPRIARRFVTLERSERRTGTGTTG